MTLRRPVAALLVVAMAMAACVCASARTAQEHRNDDVRSTTSSGRGHSERARKAGDTGADHDVSPIGPCVARERAEDGLRVPPPCAIELVAAPHQSPRDPRLARARSRAPPAA